MATSIRNLAAVAIAFPPSCRHLRLYSCESRQNQRSAEKLLYRYVAARSSTRRLPFTPALRWHPAILGYIVPKISRSINRVLHPGRNIPQQSCMSLRAFAFWGAPSLVFRHRLPLLRSLSLSPACSVLIQSVLAKRGLSS